MAVTDFVHTTTIIGVRNKPGRKNSYNRFSEESGTAFRATLWG